ncbi:serine protease [Streptomyces sp. SBR177]
MDHPALSLFGPDAGSALTVEPDASGSGAVTVRVPKGRYLLHAQLEVAPADGGGVDWVVQPALDVERDATVVLDARTARPVDVRPPDPSARLRLGGVFVEVTHGGVTAPANLIHLTPTVRIAHLGPAAGAGAVRVWADTYWEGADGIYALGHVVESDRVPAGLVRHPRPAELGTLVVRAAAPGPDAAGHGLLGFQPASGTSPGLPLPMRVPGATTFLVTPERGSWDLTYTPPGPEDSEAPVNRYEVAGLAVPAGRTVVHTFDAPVFGPALDPAPGARPIGLRTGNTLDLALALLADGDGHLPSAPPHTGARTTLHRAGVLVGTRRGTPGHASFTVPAGRAPYRLTTSAERPAGSVTASWTFVSARTSEPTELPLSVVRFVPPPAPAGAHEVAVSVHGAAERSGVRSLVVAVSADRGASWTPVPVRDGRFRVVPPAPGGTVSLRAELVDGLGNTLTQTHVDAYAYGTGAAPA